MQIRPATAADLPAIQALERATETAAHWSDNQYQSLFTAPSTRLILLAEEGIIHGFLIAQIITQDWEVENIVVAEGMRRTGLATSLLQAMIDQARHSQAESIFLEVRASNAPACAFYEKSCFQQVGIRAHYYRDPQEDAILYRLILNR